MHMLQRVHRERNACGATDQNSGALTCDHRASSHIEPARLIKRACELCHRLARAVWHDHRPGEAAHPTQASSHRVLTTFLSEDTVRGSLSGSEQLQIFDLAVEL